MHFDELVAVYSVKEPIEAEIIKNALHAEGIQAAIENENQAGLTGVFDIRILVPAPDEVEARRILAEHEAAAKNPPLDEPSDDSELPDD
jgi:hypothetical protein